MKTALLILSLTIVGCGCNHLEYPLQPGEKVIFNDTGNAQAFRQLSGNDINHTGSVVEITAPTSLLIKK